MAFYLGRLSHEGVPRDLSFCERVVNSMRLAAVLVFPSLSSSFLSLEGDSGLRTQVSEAAGASAAVVSSGRKDGDEICWDLEQSESSLGRSPEEHSRQDWVSHAACVSSLT